MDQYRRGQVLDAHLAALARRVDELVAADRDTDVRRTRRNRRKEHEVAGLQTDRPGRPVPHGIARQRSATATAHVARTRRPRIHCSRSPTDRCRRCGTALPEGRARSRQSHRSTHRRCRSSPPEAVVGVGAGRGVGKGAGTAPVEAQPAASPVTRISSGPYRIIGRIIGAGSVRVQVNSPKLLETLLLRPCGSLTGYATIGHNDSGLWSRRSSSTPRTSP